MIYIGRLGIYSKSENSDNSRRYSSRRTYKKIAEDLILRNITTIDVYNSKFKLSTINNVINFQEYSSTNIYPFALISNGTIFFSNDINNNKILKIKEAIIKYYGDSYVGSINSNYIFSGFIPKTADENLYKKSYQKKMLKNFKNYVMKSRYLKENAVLT